MLEPGFDALVRSEENQDEILVLKDMQYYLYDTTSHAQTEMTNIQLCK